MIKNETIKKLDRQEIADLGLYDKGIYTYKGDLKSRIKGFKTTKNTENERHFEGEHIRWEVIEIVATNDEGVREWAIRCFDKERNDYETFWQMIIGCEFFR